jgi:hypothetical protein
VLAALAALAGVLAGLVLAAALLAALAALSTLLTALAGFLLTAALLTALAALLLAALTGSRLLAALVLIAHERLHC